MGMIDKIQTQIRKHIENDFEPKYIKIHPLALQEIKAEIGNLYDLRDSCTIFGLTIIKDDSINPNQAFLLSEQKVG